MERQISWGGFNSDVDCPMSPMSASNHTDHTHDHSHDHTHTDHTQDRWRRSDSSISHSFNHDSDTTLKASSASSSDRLDKLESGDSRESRERDDDSKTNMVSELTLKAPVTASFPSHPILKGVGGGLGGDDVDDDDDWIDYDQFIDEDGDDYNENEGGVGRMQHEASFSTVSPITSPGRRNIEFDIDNDDDAPNASQGSRSNDTCTGTGTGIKGAAMQVRH